MAIYKNMSQQMKKQTDRNQTDYINGMTKQLTEELMKSGGKVTFTDGENGKAIENPQGLPRKTARKIARSFIKKQLGYKVGELGQSEVGVMSSRRERRAEGLDVFTPVYNGHEPVYVPHKSLLETEEMGKSE